MMNAVHSFKKERAAERFFYKEHQMKTNQVTANGPQVTFIKKSEIPESTPRGRIGFLAMLPFWVELQQVLKAGLAPSEAIEVSLIPIETRTGKKISSASLLSAIRHQFQKLGLSDQYSLLVRNNNTRLFITDHVAAALATA